MTAWSVLEEAHVRVAGIQSSVRHLAIHLGHGTTERNTRRAKAQNDEAG
jgi:hypothetical protein